MAKSEAKTPLSIRWAAIGLAVISFIWLPLEDTTVAFLMAVSVGWCAWGGSWLFHRTRQRKPISTGMSITLGGISGLMAAPLALVLALLKAGVHAHGFMDFTNHQLILVAKTAPAWTILGAAVGGLVFRFGYRQGN